jgi:hypothetical protein
MMTDKAIEPRLPQRNMKSRIHWNWSLGLVLAVLPFTGSSPQESFSQPTNNAPGVETADLAPAEEATRDDHAPAKSISMAKPLPPGVKATGPVAKVLKLVNSGVDESVMLAFVTRSTSTFKLSAEEIIYLNEVGVPSAVVIAMIQRDQVLKALSAPRKIEVTYQGFYQSGEGPKHTIFKLNEAYSVAPIGARIATNLFIADATMQALTLTNLAAQTNIVPLNEKKEILVPIH